MFHVTYTLQQATWLHNYLYEWLLDTNFPSHTTEQAFIQAIISQPDKLSTPQLLYLITHISKAASLLMPSNQDIPMLVDLLAELSASLLPNFN